MKVAVFGAGYVGCVTATSLASLGHTVWLVEISKDKLKILRSAKCPVVEPGIDDILPDQIRKGVVIPSDSPEEAVAATDLALICVGTPSLPDGTTDIRQVTAVFREFVAALKTRHTPYTLALRSTIPYPLIVSELFPVLQKGLPGRYGQDVYFAQNPEFLREGSAMNDFLHPPFIIIGTEHSQAESQLRDLYKQIQGPIHVVHTGTASFLKYACNAFHALKIVFANEIASLAPIFNTDPLQVMEIFCQDPILNISPAYLRPGFAYGGSCLPKDLKTLGRLSSLSAISTPLLDSIEHSNKQLIDRTVQSISDLGVRKIGLIGLTFKSETDDFRNSPLVEIAERLVGKGFELAIYDPDVDIRKIHGQNLRYIEERMHHLAQLLKPDFTSLATHAKLLIIGKPVPHLSNYLQEVPPDCRILDLTRQVPARENKLTIMHLETLVNALIDRAEISSGVVKS
jgi:GDP-mannose 6-dehydrogenase